MQSGYHLMVLRGFTKDCIYQCKVKQWSQSVGVFILIWGSSPHDKHEGHHEWDLRWVMQKPEWGGKWILGDICREHKGT